MSQIEIIAKDVKLIDPFPLVEFEPPAGEASESFSIEASGLGQLTGLSYTVPAHSTGEITAQLQTAALTSDDVKNLNELALGMLNASEQETVSNVIKTSASANISLWNWYFGGGGAKASYEQTYSSMKQKGLTESQIDKLMDAFSERARSMSKVQVKLFVNNTNNDYAVSGDLYLYTVSGKIKTSKGTVQYRLLADRGAAGGPPPAGGGAPSNGDVIPLS